MITRDPDASFDTPNVVIGRQGRNELTLCFRPAPYLARLLACSSKVFVTTKPQRSNYQLAWGMGRYGYCTSY